MEVNNLEKANKLVANLNDCQVKLDLIVNERKRIMRSSNPMMNLQILLSHDKDGATPVSLPLNKDNIQCILQVFISEHQQHKDYLLSQIKSL